MNAMKNPLTRFKMFRKNSVDDYEDEDVINHLAMLGEAFGVDNGLLPYDVFEQRMRLNGVGKIKDPLKYAIVYACIKVYAGAIAQIPLQIYERRDSGPVRANQYADLEKLFNLQPQALFSASAWWEHMVSNIHLQGNALANIRRDQSGRPVALEARNSSGVSMFAYNSPDNEIRKGYEFPELAYYASLGSMGQMVLRNREVADQDDVLDFPNSLSEGLRSRSTISAGVSIALKNLAIQEDFVSDFFSNDPVQSTWLSSKEPLNADQRKRTEKAYAKYAGMKGRKKAMLLDGDVQLHERKLNATDMQLLESREFSALEIARSFQIPSSMLNYEQKTTSFGSGVEFLGTIWLRNGLMPMVKRIEDELERKLLPDSHYVKFEVDALTRPLFKNRMEAYDKAKFFTWNEIREREGLPQLEGEEYNVPIGLMMETANGQEQTNGNGQAEDGGALSEETRAAIEAASGE